LSVGYPPRPAGSLAALMGVPLPAREALERGERLTRAARAAALARYRAKRAERGARAGVLCPGRKANSGKPPRVGGRFVARAAAEPAAAAPAAAGPELDAEGFNDDAALNV
jgi:hypothetical protein